ncbi:hypothetical protein MTO96_026538 [Rhipicephalus appendiculatus]
MSSFMRRHFKWYGIICKSSGLLILHSPKTSESEEEVFSWKKLYLIYSVACIFVCAFVDISYFYELWLAVLVHDLVFTTTLYVLVCIFDAAKITLNATLMLTKARSLQKFFDESSKYEQRVRFVAPKNRRKATLACYFIRSLLLAAFVANVCTSSYLSLEFVDNLGCSPILGATWKLTYIAGNFLFYVFDAAPFLVLRPCCEVIRLYIEHQHGVLRYIVRSGGNDYVGPEKRARLVEKAVSGAMVLWASCTSIYLNFIEEFWTPEHYLSLIYTISSFLDFLDIAILSDAMVKEVIYLRDCLKPGEMALSGAGFFSMKLPTLVSLAGAVITYTVILVQTSESVKKGCQNLKKEL